jgi:hypothetical protein
MNPISTTTRLSRAVNIEDLRELARRRVPRIVFNYIDGGAEDEWTLRTPGLSPRDAPRR